MASIPVIVRHRGEKYPVDVEPDSTGLDFKLQIYSLTDVEPGNQKIIWKGTQLKDDVVMGNLALKPNMTIQVMGSPNPDGIDLVRPRKPMKFIEDMTEAEQARQANAVPAGLINLGNTCYLNATLQTLRAIPELHESLVRYNPNPSHASLSMGASSLDLAAQLSGLYKKMSETQEAFPPFNFLNALRGVYPQFAEKSRSGAGYAQQDAEEAWSQIIQQLGLKLKTKPDEKENRDAESFINQYMSGQFVTVMECNDPEAREAGEQPNIIQDSFRKLNCHIDSSTNHLRDGIQAALKETLEKKSTILGRDAKYTKTSKICRAPQYLTVHFVRFFWKRETQKKAKIMRKVTFPHELDIVEFCTDDLKKALVPVRDKVREIRKDEEDIERARKRRKKSTHPMVSEDAVGGDREQKEREKKEREEKRKKKEEAQKAADGDTVMGEAGEVYKTDAQIEAEREEALLQAKKELHALIDGKLRKDEGANQSGLYELRGVVTHQGASADSGHYTAYVKKTAPVDPKTGKKIKEEDGNWWWFNDDKVAEVTPEKIESLAGGGESHSALILLYKAIPLPSAEGTME